MTDFEYQILCYIRSKGTCKWLDVLNAFNPQTLCNFTHALMASMCETGFIKAVPPDDLCNASVSLHPAAMAAIERYEQQLEELRQEAAKEECRRRDDRNFALKVALASAVVGALLGNLPYLIQLIRDLCV